LLKTHAVVVSGDVNAVKDSCSIHGQSVECCFGRYPRASKVYKWGVVNRGLCSGRAKISPYRRPIW